MRGKFITFEGVGKTTQINSLENMLRDMGISVVVTREPGGTYLGAELRNMILDGQKYGDLDPITESLLLAADRMYHLKHCILSNLEEGRVVLCDRYIHSTYAYQGYGRGVDMEFLKKINEPALDLTRPDLTILLDCEPSVSLKRKDFMVFDKIESEDISFHERVHNGFRELAKTDSNVVVVDADLPETIVENSVNLLVDKLLNLSLFS